MELIRNNPYRTIGLLVGSSAKDQDRHIKRLKQFLIAQQEPEEDFSLPLIGRLNRTIDSVNEAASKLNLDNDRMISALFWFYNGNVITDEPAFDSLKDGKFTEAELIWSKLTKDKVLNKKNASAFHNLSTLLLHSALNEPQINSQLLEQSLTLKMKFLESEYVFELINIATDQTYKTSKKHLQIIFLNQVLFEVENLGGISTNKFIDIINRQDFSGKDDFLKEIIQKPIDSLLRRIDETATQRQNNRSFAYDFGKQLYEESLESLKLLKTTLGKSDNRFTSISDKVNEEILQCLIDAFNLAQKKAIIDKGEVFKLTISQLLTLMAEIESNFFSEILKERFASNFESMNAIVVNIEDTILKLIANDEKTCWYCGENGYKTKQVDYSKSRTIQNGAIKTTTTYTKTVKIHICENCDKTDRRQGIWYIVGIAILVFLEFLIAYLILMKNDNWDFIWWVIIPNIIGGYYITKAVGGLMGYGLYLLFDKKEFSRVHIRELNDHPLVKLIKSEGYS